MTHLLIATKQLLETLTHWSRHTATEGEVSDIYVRLGYEFNIACRAFNSIGVDTSDLGPVPESLRAILEETLSQEASPASLDRFLPRIRDIIIALLHGLKRKQQRLRKKTNKENTQDGGALTPSGSSGNLATAGTQMSEEVYPQGPGERGSSERRVGSGGSMMASNADGEWGSADEHPPRYSSAQPTRQRSGGAPGETSNRGSRRESQRQVPVTLSDSGSSNGTLHSTYQLEGNAPQTQSGSNLMHNTSQKGNLPSMQPPPAPPKQQDALAALQRGGDLERRASRRYSAYQISKHLGASPNGVPMMPPAQHGPIPNRGRETRESLTAVRNRGSGNLSRQKSNRRGETSPVRNGAISHRISEEGRYRENSRQQGGQAGDASAPHSTLEPPGASPDSDRPKMRATLTSPLEGIQAYNSPDGDDIDPGKPPQRVSTDQRSISPQSIEGNQVDQFVAEQSPQPGKELTLFLQYKSKIKKFVLPEGSNDLSVARLQLAFIEKFAWNTHNNGNDLPEIYIQDPVSGVRHELEDLRDVKDRSVLVLNIEVLDEVKRHIDEGIGGLRKMVEGVRTVVDSQQTALQQVSDRQQDTTREVVRLTSNPKGPLTVAKFYDKPKVNGIIPSTILRNNPKRASDQISSIQNLRQDLAVVRQTFSSLVSDMNSSMTTVQTNASSIKTMAVDGVLPNLDPSTGRGYVDTGKKSLGEESEKIVNCVDDLQDVVEDLRKDVVLRGVRPLPRQLETVSKSISTATADLKKMQEFLRREKPIWTKIWEKELELVCNDRDLLTMQEELAADLEDDLEKATQTFALVEQATKQQNLQSGQGQGVALRSTSKGLAAIASDQDIDPMKAKDGVLGEVRALRPNHETRLEAIERAEKARQRELESRREGEFTKEVASFVEEGRLKKSGGVEEAERLRKARDEKNMRTAWETQQDRAAGKGKRVESGPAPEPEREEVVPSAEEPAMSQDTTEERDEVPGMEEQAKSPVPGELAPSTLERWKAD